MEASPNVGLLPPRLAWPTAWISVPLIVAGAIGLWRSEHDAADPPLAVVAAASSAVLAGLGALIASRTGNRLGWLDLVVRHAAWARSELRLDLDRSDLVIIVRDDSGGFDPMVTAGGEGMQIMGDRIAALDSSLSVDSGPGRGTTVKGRVAANQLEPTA
jgi:hypothetical protein